MARPWSQANPESSREHLITNAATLLYAAGTHRWCRACEPGPYLEASVSPQCGDGSDASIYRLRRGRLVGDPGRIGRYCVGPYSDHFFRFQCSRMASNARECSRRLQFLDVALFT